MWRSTGAEREQHRSQLDAARAGGSLGVVALLPFLTTYAVVVLALAGPAELAKGLFSVVFAVLLIGSSFGPGRRWRPTRTSRLVVVAGSVLLGVVVALLVDRGLG